MSKINMIRKEGGSRIVCVTSIIPKTWRVVELTKVKEKDSTILVEFKKVQ